VLSASEKSNRGFDEKATERMRENISDNTFLCSHPQNDQAMESDEHILLSHKVGYAMPMYSSTGERKKITHHEGCIGLPKNTKMKVKVSVQL